jgi:hypothetical protein
VEKTTNMLPVDEITVQEKNEVISDHNILQIMYDKALQSRK